MATDMTEINFDVKGMIVGLKAAQVAFAGLDRVLSSVAETIGEVFSVDGYQDYQKTVSRLGKELTDELLVLKLSFGQMKYAIAEAVAPIASVFVPMLNSAIQAVIQFSNVVRQFLSGLLGGIFGTQKFSAATDTAAESQKKLGSAAKSAGKAVRRSLASFDQLERLNNPTGSGGSSGSADVLTPYVADPISPQVQAMVDKVLALLQPLLTINLQPIQAALQNLWTSACTLASAAGEMLSFLWYEILTPFIAWVMETFAPAMTEHFAAKLDLVSAALGPVTEGIRILWEALKPVVAFIGSSVVQALELWRQSFLQLGQTIQEKHPTIVGIFSNLAQMATQAWAIVGPVLTTLRNHFQTVFSGVSQTVSTTVGYILDMLYGLTSYMAGAFSGNWQQAWEGIRLFLKSAVNGVITLLNAMVSRLVAALNAVVRAANKLSFTVPDWVPTIGGRRFGVNLSSVSAPQIPYLAKGAVLPANKPFLAMVGDQRHGTNVEAPLSTIQDAVALVMEDQTQAILRGFEASVGVQREILEAVLGIHIGDDMLGRAVERYNRRVNALQGGF